MIDRRQALAVAVGGILGSQAGHLLTFQLLFGSAAQHLQSSGAHAYFPLLAKTALGVVASIVLAGMFVIGLARMVSGQSRVAAGYQKPFLELFAILFTIQLACFIVQEIAEAMVAGTAASAPQLLLGGTLGQLPVAALAAIGLGWLLTHFESAVEELRAVLSTVSSPSVPTLLTVGAGPAANGGLLLRQSAGASLSRRGPPTS
ncbi:MAG TPA: hypothetical protein VND96_15550 [Candidatus Micrarchaeaceae archaeon]|nr:hypothetical protein [Candidatus Micrarchaeaceae archaeon]